MLVEMVANLTRIWVWLLISVFVGCNLPPSRSPQPNYWHSRSGEQRATGGQGRARAARYDLQRQVARYDKPIVVKAKLDLTGLHGRWSGKIAGRGISKLMLLFYSRGRLIGAQRMGETVLNLKGVPFVFETELPSEINLATFSWRIVGA